MAKEYLDKSGLTYLWAKLKNSFAVKNHTHTEYYPIYSFLGGTSTDTPTDLIKNALTNGNLPYGRTFTARISAGYQYFAVGQFFQSGGKTYGSVIIGRHNKIYKVLCNADAWTEAEI